MDGYIEKLFNSSPANDKARSNRDVLGPLDRHSDDDISCPRHSGPRSSPGCSEHGHFTEIENPLGSGCILHKYFNTIDVRSQYEYLAGAVLHKAICQCTFKGGHRQHVDQRRFRRTWIFFLVTRPLFISHFTYLSFIADTISLFFCLFLVFPLLSDINKVDDTRYNSLVSTFRVIILKKMYCLIVCRLVVSAGVVHLISIALVGWGSGRDKDDRLETIPALEEKTAAAIMLY